MHFALSNKIGKNYTGQQLIGQMQFLLLQFLYSLTFFLDEKPDKLHSKSVFEALFFPSNPLYISDYHKEDKQPLTVCPVLSS